MKNDLNVFELIEEYGVHYEPDENEIIETQERTGSVEQSEVVEYVPFPVDVLPKLLADFVRQAVASIGCDESMVVNPLLVALAGAIGSKRHIVLKADWQEPCILWAMTVAVSGDKKSAPFRIIKRFFKKIEQQWHDDYKTEMAQYLEDLERYRTWKGDGTEPQPECPKEPIKKRLIMDDVTVEAIADLLSNNPQGLIIFRDEISGWFFSFGQYKNGKSDESFWLECYEAGIYSVDRKGAKTTLYIPKCSVSIYGTIQPVTLGRYLSNRTAVENGMLQRFLASAPPERKSQWSDVEIGKNILEKVQKLFDDLLTLDFHIDSDGKEQPVGVRLTPEARQLFVNVVDQYGLEKMNCLPDLKAFWAKMPGKIARIALVIHEARIALQEIGDSREVGVDSMQSAIAIGRWYANEASRIYSGIGCSSEPLEVREGREILDVIRAYDDPMSISEIGQKMKKYRDPAGRNRCEKYLRSFVAEGIMKSEMRDTGGRQKEVFFFAK